jgi:hypothetical protein
MQNSSERHRSQRLLRLNDSEGFQPTHQLNNAHHQPPGIACAEADIAIKPTTVSARISVIFTGNSWCAGSASHKITFVDDPPLQLLCDYYLVYNFKLLVTLSLVVRVSLRSHTKEGLPVNLGQGGKTQGTSVCNFGTVRPGYVAFLGDSRSTCF